MSKRSARLNPAHPFNTQAKQRQAAHAAGLHDDIARMVICGNIHGLKLEQQHGVNLSRNRVFKADGPPSRTATPLIFSIYHHQNPTFEWLLQQRLWLDHASSVSVIFSNFSRMPGTRPGTALDAAYQENGTYYVRRLIESGARKALLPENLEQLAYDLKRKSWLTETVRKPLPAHVPDRPDFPF